jgi:hypothetical protein
LRPLLSSAGSEVDDRLGGERVGLDRIFPRNQLGNLG